MTIQDSTRTIGTNIKHFFSGTMISRLTGLAREVAMAAVFGTTPAIAAFWMAFRFAHLLRRLFGEGALHIAFVPHFETLRKQDPAVGAKFFYHLCSALTLVLLSIIILSELILGATLFFCKMSPGNCEVIRLTMLMLPALVFISLYALNTSLLNCKSSYFLPSVAPAFLNVIWIGAILLLYQLPVVQAIEYLAMIIVCAFAFQWAATMPPVICYLKETFGQRSWGNFSLKELITIARPFALGMLGVAATQLNSAIDTLFARAADPEGPAYLWYAIRIQQLPLGLIGVGLTGAILPPLARAIQNQERGQYLHFLNFALKQALLFMAPITVALFALGLSSINLIYGHGQFSQTATLQTTLCLWAYGLSLVPMTLVLITAAAFYAHKNYRIPTLIALSTILLNLLLNALFVFLFQWGAISVALATAAAAWANAILLIYFLNREYGISFAGIPLPLTKVLLAAFFASTATIALGTYVLNENTLNCLLGAPLMPLARTLSTQLFSLMTQGSLFILLFFLAAYLLRLKELFSFRKRAIENQLN